MKSNEFITADTHFGHENIIKYSKRPFKNADEMDAEIIKRWNDKIPKNALVYHLGDFSFSKPGRIIQVLNQLNGRICLVKGNHDKYLKGQDILGRFEWVKDYYESKTEDGTLVSMFHYAMLVWNKHAYGGWALHGHSHGSLRVDNTVKRMDVGIDTNDYKPYSYQEIEKIMKSRGGQIVDHHKPRKNEGA